MFDKARGSLLLFLLLGFQQAQAEYGINFPEPAAEVAQDGTSVVVGIRLPRS